MVALPVVTYGDRVSLHLDKGEVHVIYVKNAHTDGDSIIHFFGNNVIHAGDTYFNGFYPFIDASTGGSLDGRIVAVELILEMVG